MTLPIGRRRALPLSILAIALAGGCGAADPAGPARDAAVAAAPPDAGPPSWIAALTARFADGDTRDAAITELAQASMRGEVSVADAAAAIAMSASLGAADQAAVIDALLLHVRPGHGALLEHLDDQLAPAARSRALVLLATSTESTAHASLARLLGRHADEPQPWLFVAMRKQRRPGVAVALLPLLDRPAHAAAIAAAALDHCRARVVTAAELAPHAARLIARWQTSGDPVVLELLGCLPRAAALDVLRDGANRDDPRQALAAIRGLARLRVPPRGAVLDRLARRSDARAALFAQLQAAGWQRRFPRALATQAALAEAVLVAHLAAADQLGQPPSEIEALEVIEVDVGPPIGVLTHHVFRFRIAAPHPHAEHDWMLGVAGPFVQDDAPTVDDHGGTTARLRAAGATRPAQLVDVAAVQAAWQEDLTEPLDDDAQRAQDAKDRRAKQRRAKRRRARRRR